MRNLHFFQLESNLLKDAKEWLQNLYEAARKGGLPPFPFAREKTAIELNTAHRDYGAPLDDETLRQEYRKMLTRNRVRRWRERQKRKKRYKT
ncbi:MAG: hypothetical protein IJ657_07255 [Acidaminococcaceae bacterium]|nr:hypothetical protein [Acidaminococcaceae bacterium]MBR1590849.1 hypothetical protein [Acidaminococcaceae bacterium]